jgi:hypothetical protein
MKRGRRGYMLALDRIDRWGAYLFARRGRNRYGRDAPRIAEHGERAARYGAWLDEIASAMETCRARARAAASRGRP